MTTFNLVGRDQINYNFLAPGLDNANCHQPHSLQRVNDAPLDLLSIHFTGREKELVFIKEAMRKHWGDLPSRCAVYGMPGIGKTQLLLQFVKVSFGQRQYSHVFWMSSTTVDKLHQGFAKLLDLVGHPDRDRQEQSAKLTAARRWLEGSHGEDDGIRWLLVLDNVHNDTLHFLRSHLPNSHSRGNILFSTRTAEVAEVLVNAAGEQYSILGLQTLDLPDSADLLLRDAGIDVATVTPSFLHQAEKLVGCVGRLPLAIVHAASFMKQTGTTLDAMLELYMTKWKIEAIRWENSLTPYEEQSVAATFTNQINQLDPESRDIKNLLTVLSFLDPEKIPVEMIVEGAKDLLRSREQPLQPPLPPNSVLSYAPENRSQRGMKIQTDGSSPASSESQSLISLILTPFAFQKAIQKLSDLSLVERRSSIGDASLWMHDLIQFIVQESARTEETHQEWLQLCVSLVYSTFQHIKDYESPRSWADCEKFIPHLRSLNQAWSDVYGMNSELTEAKARMTIYLRSRGRYGEAEEWCKQALEVRQKHLGAHHPDTLLLVNILTLVHESQGRHYEAGALQQRALAAQEERLGANHPNTFFPMNNLAFVYQSQGLYDQAEELQKCVSAGWENYLGGDHPNTLTSMNNLASVYRSQGRYDEAEDLQKRVLAGWGKDLGFADHPDVMFSMGNLAEIYQSQGRYGEAEALQNRVSTSWERHLGTDHPNTLMSMSNLAGMYLSQGRHDEAEVLLKSVLASWERHLGADHPNTLMTKSNLGEVYQLQAQYGEAEMLHQQALTGWAKHFGTDHPNALTSMDNLALVYQSQGRFDEAEAALNQVLASRERCLGHGHSETRTTRDNLDHLRRLRDGSVTQAESTQPL